MPIIYITRTLGMMRAVPNNRYHIHMDRYPTVGLHRIIMIWCLMAQVVIT